LTEVNLPIDKISRKPKGFGTVTFMMPEHAVKAYTELDGSIQDGRMLHLLPAKAKTSPEDLLLQGKNPFAYILPITTVDCPPTIIKLHF
jgi:multiple RNA-binding domain-containing protein 1